jgi:hypothetical protein
MPAPFGITTTAATIRLDDGLQAEAAFTVLNQTGVPVRARAFVVAQPPLDPSCVRLDGTADRSFPVGGAEQYLVAVAMPAGSAEGQYRFRLDAVAADQTDAEATQGPAVAFDVPHVEPIPIPAEPRGYLRTWLGALIGALPGTILGGVLGFALASVLGPGIVAEPSGAPAASPPPDLGAALGDAIGKGLAAGLGYAALIIALTFLGMVLGLWLGEALGSWLALRLGHYPSPWRTAVPLAVISPFASAAILFVMGTVLGTDPPGIVVWLVVLSALLGLVSVPALAGRAFYRWRTTGGL